MDVEVNVRERVLKPIAEVFDAIIDPTKLAQFFVSHGSAPLRSGTKVEWEFADVGASISVDVIEVVQDERIVFEWAAPGTKTRVTIRMQADDPSTTVVIINEAAFAMDEQGVKRAMGQTGGWTYFLACLKGYVQFGINLRVGLNKKITDV